MCECDGGTIAACTHLERPGDIHICHVECLREDMQLDIINIISTKLILAAKLQLLIDTMSLLSGSALCYQRRNIKIHCSLSKLCTVLAISV